ncbi:trypsin-1-like [Schistocerca americana]|uniref:trypsin-1-like n=1 Tax=Schistocerca americana TaxID=7009 RepID=UPI001F502D06|nr:trypsin-1-like [Schistocerca americana]
MLLPLLVPVRRERPAAAQEVDAASPPSVLEEGGACVRRCQCVVCPTLDRIGVSRSPGGVSTGDTTPPEHISWIFFAGEFPYQVSLQHVVLGLRYHNCGGSILSSTAILTAGHCAVSLGHYVAVAGDYDLSSNEGSEQEIRVSDQTVHPLYPGGVAANDIAVFTLQSSLSLGTYVQAISLPSAGSIPAGGSTAVISGWGTTETASTPDILQTVDVSIIDYETCSQNIDDLDLGTNPLTETMVCTGPIYDGISVCSGDSGGPLAQNGELIGVVSWGVDPCGYPGAPSVFTRVSAHLDFINQNL